MEMVVISIIFCSRARADVLVNDHRQLSTNDG